MTSGLRQETGDWRFRLAFERETTLSFRLQPPAYFRSLKKSLAPFSGTSAVIALEFVA
jgi:hypothetical protein